MAVCEGRRHQEIPHFKANEKLRKANEIHAAT